MKFEDSEAWKDAIKGELDSLQRHGTWEDIDRPESTQVISTRLMFLPYYDKDGNVRRNKACLVDTGFMQGHLGDLFAPVAV